MTQASKPASDLETLTEGTEAGEQMLAVGVRPITTRDRLTLMALRPMAPKRNPNANQKPCDVGLFDEVQRNQIDLIDFSKSSQSTTPNP